jgi:hypothetical protein
MTRLFTLALAILATFTVSAQTIPNASFENWVPYTTGELPVGWTTSDSIAVALGGGSSVFSGLDAFDGSLSIHMKSINTALGIKGPGVATNGKIGFSGTFTFSEGSPDTSRSEFLTGQYKYAPMAANDVAVISAVKLRFNGTSRDTIALAFQELSAQASYTSFQIPFVYVDFVNQPDSIIIVMQSSRNINDPDLGVGSELVVDDLGFSGYVNINDPAVIASFSVYPQPATDKLNIDLQLRNADKIAIDIFDLTGRRVLSSSLNEGSTTFDVSALSTGRYAVKLTNQNGQPVYSTSVSIVR